jgi:hypothetical protein
MDRGCHAPVVNASALALSMYSPRASLAHRSRSNSAIQCLPEIRCTGRRGRVRRGSTSPDACRCSVCTRPPRASRYRCATEYVKYAHESSVNTNKSARIQTQDTAQKSSCCFPTHVCQSLHHTARDTSRIVELRRLASQIQPQPTHPSVHRADSERATMAAVH